MRDPQARLVLAVDQVNRHLSEALPEQHPLHTVAARQWVAAGHLVPFDWLDERLLVSPKIPFVSSPEEWCDAQLLDAARLTLELLELANAEAADLKDASAWNVIFDGCKPVFCDLTSLEPIQSHAWWAAGQFVTPEQRHAGQDKEILQKRHAVYEAAKCSKPGRWKSRQTRNWEHVKEVWLNPPREHVGLPEKVAIAV